MTNLEKYNQAFVEVFGVSADALNDNFAKDTRQGHGGGMGFRPPVEHHCLAGRIL